MSSLSLHASEESIALDLSDAIKAVPTGSKVSPISDYFDVTQKLKIKIIGSTHRDDAEILGLLALGVISAAEFYIRNIIATVVSICPVAQRHCELAVVPSGSFAFYAGSVYPHMMSCFDHESFADAAKIKSHCGKYTGLAIEVGGSVPTALSEFDKVCELRHSLVHARGYVGLKASRALGLQSRAPGKVLLSQSSALEILKVCHNLVRALNNFLVNGVADRWIASGHLTGDWAHDHDYFTSLIHSFWVKGEDAYGGIVYRAYAPYKKAALARSAALLAKVGG